jgi:hypothetical protein
MRIWSDGQDRTHSSFSCRSGSIAPCDFKIQRRNRLLTPESVVFRPGSDGEPGPLALIVEDEFFIAMALEALLTSHGWRVLGPALSIEDALLLLRTKRPDAGCARFECKR